MNIYIIIFALVIWAHDTCTKKIQEVNPTSKWQLDKTLRKSNSNNTVPAYLLVLKDLPRYPNRDQYSIFPTSPKEKEKNRGKIRDNDNYKWKHKKLKFKFPKPPNPKPYKPPKPNNSPESPKDWPRFDISVSLSNSDSVSDFRERVEY